MTSVARLAAQANAEWCDTFCRTHGVPGQFADDCWWSPERTPPLYPDAVTLAPDVDAADLLARIEAGAGCSVKDSFATLDLAAHGFRPLIQAEWLVSEHEHGRAAQRWSVIETADQLAEWEAAWGEAAEPGFFRPGLLLDPAVAFLGRYDDDGVLRAGAIANRCRGAAGVSNLFAADGDLESAWQAAAATAHARWPSVLVVGYDSGPSLQAARRAGFESVGDLTIWAA